MPSIEIKSIESLSIKDEKTGHIILPGTESSTILALYNYLLFDNTDNLIAIIEDSQTALEKCAQEITKKVLELLEKPL